jgi:flagellar assembly protein FliH
MKSLSNIYKSRAVTIDKDNAISIEIMTFIPEPPEPEPPAATDEEIAESAAEKARQLIKKAGAEAEQILKKARAEAEKLAAETVAAANAEAGGIRSAARKEGYDEGYSKAEAEGQKIIDEANKVLADARAERTRMQETLEPEMVTLVADIVKKLLGDTVALYPETIVNLIRQGIAGEKLTGPVQIRVCEDDFKTVIKVKEELAALADSSVQVEIVRDPSLKHTDCVVETPFGSIDVSLSQQFGALRDQLLFILGTRDE